ncbi:uncharacterized protein METZ01_LOCUS488022, partial [marine metagenome]
MKSSKKVFNKKKKEVGAIVHLKIKKGRENQ